MKSTFTWRKCTKGVGVDVASWDEGLRVHRLNPRAGGSMEVVL